MPIDAELRLKGDAVAVRRARKFVREVLVESANDLIDDAELAASELVTNAVLHTESDVRIRVRVQGPSARIEVYDESLTSPLPAQPGVDATTGRGLALVGSLATTWGVETTAEGKLIWCELGGSESESGADLEHGSAADWFTDELDALGVADVQPAARGVSVTGEPTLEVQLGDVPTDLLVSAKEHSDNLVRELELANLGANSGVTDAIPPDMIALVDTVLGQFSSVRRALKHQAMQAAAEGRERTTLRLTVPVSTAAVAESYLDALEQADAFARAARLLTLATPPQHRAFRRWYVRTLVRQLRAAERGEPPEPPVPFEQHLLDELDAVTTAQQAAEMLATRLSHLQELTAELTDATDVGDIAEVFVTHATDAFGATFAAVYELAGDRLNVLRSDGVSADRMAGWASLPVDAHVPASVAVRTGLVEAVPYGPELVRRYPTLTYAAMEHRSIMCAPMRVGDRTLGVIALTLDEHRDVTDPQEIAFLASLANACAQALDRARALAAERRTTDKLEVLAAASSELVSSMDHHTTFENIAKLLVPRFADWAAIRVITDGAFDEMAVAHVDARGRELALALGDIHNDPEEGLGSAVVVRTGKPMFMPVVTDQMLAAGARDEHHLRLLRGVGVESLIIVPLLADGKAVGFLSMGYGVSGRRYEEADLRFAGDLAHRAALAVRLAQRFQQQTGQLATITRIAEAAQHAILTDVPDRVGAVQLAGSYVSAAREALIGGDMYEVVPVSGGVRLLVGDARGKGLDAVRLATVVLGFFRSAAAEPISLAGLAWQMDRRLGPYLEEEDFVTAVMVEIDSAGHCQVVSCGHPFPLLFDAAGMREVECPISLPLGLDAQPRTVHLDLSPGDRLLLYTDGLVEARDPDGRYVDLMEVAAPLRRGDLRAGLDDVLVRLRRSSREELDDDLSLLAAEYLPLPER